MPKQFPFSEGPWHVSGNGPKRRVIAAGRTIAWVQVGSKTVQKDEANARLIESGPEMYEAINHLLDQLRAARDNQPEAFEEFVNEICGPRFSDACIAAAQVIAKVNGTGGQP